MCGALTTSAVKAAGKHLFPFRTEKLSLLAPMVLGGQPPGRVGSRRFSSGRASGPFFAIRWCVYYDDNVLEDRLDGYISGYVDGEGSFSISVQRNSSCRVGFQLVPEFHVSQNGDRAQVLALIRDRFGCGYIKANSKRDRALVFVVRERQALLAEVIPFFERVPLLSAKRADFEKLRRS
jgi:LAGLIDADG endonuclease